jgi:hypothetical protein
MYHQHEIARLPNGRWGHIYGPQDVHPGERVPGTPDYATVEEAVAAVRMHATQDERGAKAPNTPYDQYLMDTPPDSYKYGRMRTGMLPTDPMQSIIAPLEHREFAREAVGRNPLMAAPMAAAIPMWTLFKALGIIPRGPNTSPASMDEIFAGYEGLFSGLGDSMRKKRKPEDK